jgi:hypothetical protein
MLKQTVEIIQQALANNNIDEFSQITSVKIGVKKLNQRLKYAALVWNAWNSYCQGNELEMLRFLQQAFHHSPFTFTSEIILDWVNDFVRLSKQKGEELDTVALTQFSSWKQVVEQALGVGYCRG